MQVFTTSYYRLQRGYEGAYLFNTLMLMLWSAACIASGAMADKLHAKFAFPRNLEIVVHSGVFVIVVISPVFFWLLASHELWLCFSFHAVLISALGAVAGPLQGWAATSFVDPLSRNCGLGAAFNLAACLGGLNPFIAALIIANFSSAGRSTPLIGFYLCIMAGLCSVSISTASRGRVLLHRLGCANTAAAAVGGE